MPSILYWFLRFSFLNPICIRLIGAASRRQRDLYIRGVYLGLLAGVLFIGLAGITGGQFSLRELAAGSAGVFTLLASLQFVVICVLTPLFMAGAITKEANPKTWDILLTTPMSPLQIVLGNLFGRLFFVIALSLAAIPLMIVTQFFGGVPLETILMTQLVAICLALAIASSAIAMSVTRTAGNKAAVSFFVITIFVLGVTFGIDSFIRMPVGNSAGSYTTIITPFNPFLVLETLLNPTGYLVPETSEVPQPLAWMLIHPVAGWCWFTVCLSCVLITWSATKVRKLGIKQTGQGLITKIFKKNYFASNYYAVSGNPIAWRERVTRQRKIGLAIARWGFVAITTLVFIILTTMYLTQLMKPDLYRDAILILIISEILIVIFLAISLSASTITKEREDGTLDILLTTAITPQIYLMGKLKGIIFRLLPIACIPCVSMFAIGIIVLANPPLAIVSDIVPIEKSEITLALYLGAMTMPITFIPFVYFCITLGLLWSMKSRGSIGAIITTFTMITIIGSGIGVCLIPTSSIGLGTFFAALFPITDVFLILRSAYIMPDLLEQPQGLSAINWKIGVSSIVAGLIWFGVSWGLLRNMAISFVPTVRKLAGQG